MNIFESEWPVCEYCGHPLHFVIQIYKKDFPDFYFPDGSNIFSIFRCPNFDCPKWYKTDAFDHPIFLYFGEVDMNGENKTFEKPPDRAVKERCENEVVECYFKPRKVDDYPDRIDYPQELLDYGVDEILSEEFKHHQYTKYGGWPARIQGDKNPDCKCGKVKSMFFQLGTDEPDDPDKKGEFFGDHGLELGDVGVITFYKCDDCGLKSIESIFECY